MVARSYDVQVEGQNVPKDVQGGGQDEIGERWRLLHIVAVPGWMGI